MQKRGNTAGYARWLAKRRLAYAALKMRDTSLPIAVANYA
jgi:hypothetical protein